MYQQRSSSHGTILSTSTDLCVGQDNNQSVVKSIRINHLSACTLVFSFYDASTATTSTIYQISLAAGDILTDTFPYHLNDGDKITATSTPTGASFTVEVENGPNIGVRCK